MNMQELLKLTMINGTSGREDAVRAYILEELQALSLPEDAVRVDRLGNVLVHKKGAATPKKRVLLTAHMDEVALMVTYIYEDGSLAFDCVGGVNASAVIGRTVTVNGLTGVIGSKPIHLLSDEEKKKPASMKALTIDIGASSKTEAMQYVRLGDIAYFDTKWRRFGADSLAAKAIDDRFGCAVLLDLLRSDLPYDTDFAFLVQEEVGLRGALPAANAVDPDIALIFEATTAADLPDSTGADRVCELGRGAVISLIDGRTIYDKALYDLAVSVCDEQHIPWQTKTKIAGGNDAGAIQNAGHGVRVLAISVPCRYLHAPVSVIRESDAEACAELATAMLSAVQERLA